MTAGRSALKERPRREDFALEYLRDFNATQAALRCGYSPRTAGAQGSRLLKCVDIAEQIAAARFERSMRSKVNADRVLEEVARLAFADIRKAVKWQANVTGMVEDEDGVERLAVTNQVQIVDSDQLDDDTAAAVAEVAQTDKGGLRIKLHDKLGALTLLSKHLGLLGPGDGPTVNVNVGVALVDRPPRETREEWLERKRLEREARLLPGPADERPG